MKFLYPTLQTTVFMGLFLVVYLWLLLRRAVKNKLDIYDFMMLSTLALVPASFVFFPETMTRLTRLIGVEFPFVVLFGMVNFIAFVMLYRLIRKTNKLKTDLVSVIQQLAIENIGAAESKPAEQFLQGVAGDR